MCGIAGCWNLNSRPLHRPTMDTFIDTLAHRGPDGRGTFFDVNDSLFLGHRRLSILDLSEEGAQPMRSADKRFVVTFNGEIYNFLEIRQELEAKGHRFHSESDTEVLLTAYQEWGPDCQLKFNGMWAFAIWDKLRCSLFLSRDRFGVKPLHYWYDGSTFAFASELKAFLALPQWPFDFDEESIGISILGDNFLEATEQTILKDVKRLPAGTSLYLRRGNRPPVLRRWWRTLEHLEEVPTSYTERIERFRELFNDACRLRMRSDVPIGTALSGGLDSSSILGSITQANVSSGQRSAPHSYTSFVSSYPNSQQDETAFAQEMIRNTGVKGEFMATSPQQALEQLDAITFSQEEIYSFRGTIWFLYQLMRRKKVVVSIDGHGGDELLGGYHHHPIFHLLDRANLARPGLPSAREIQECVRSMFPAGEIPPHYQPSEYIPKNLPQPTKRFCTSWLPQTSYTSRFPYYAADESHLQSANHLQKRLYYDFHYATLPTILRNFDRFSMAHGVEVRSPFLDWRLVRYSFSLPSSDKIANGYSKKILRDSVVEAVPDSIRLRKSKVGFLEPFEKWLGEGFNEKLREIVNDPAFLQSPYWKGKHVRDIAEKAYQENNTRNMKSPWTIAHAHLLTTLFKSQRRQLIAAR
ncbi:asparagine synthase (glutamine-hydrolyzing) [Pelagicoccus sp. NFK12]|uniref:asparagine synthase (glutamine-hydrolyzing) n=1 Tax=Pelagicoccus enzymogenes TaxID=2773457 RepID=A0A927FCX6_9BACT|nr:asparagine synthase (glutamine-hydrolyzing) [Pelagicoccus enzymogenes]MBD5781400.1 asparagine synthase (glutamine-hydrolyzing) [Pelagicoccus enzymogenes]